MFVAYFIIINIVSFALYGLDKRKAIRKKWRISERNLFGIAVFGGALGALFAMVFFRHKTQHILFKVGVPAVLIVQVLLILILKK